MNIKIKYPHSRGHIRVENDVEIKEIFVKEDIMNPKGEIVSIGFRNKESSGLIEFKRGELDHLMRSIRGKTHLIKDMKIIRDDVDEEADDEPLNLM